MGTVGATLEFQRSKFGSVEETLIRVVFLYNMAMVELLLLKSMG